MALETPPPPLLPIRIMGDAICLPMMARGIAGAPGHPHKSLWFEIKQRENIIFHMKVDPALFPWVKLNEMVQISLTVLQVTAEGENAPPPILGLKG